MFDFPANIIFVKVTKGLYPEKIYTLCQILQEFFPAHPIVVLSGINLFQEMDKELPTTKI